MDWPKKHSCYGRTREGSSLTCEHCSNRNRKTLLKVGNRAALVQNL